MPDFNDVAIYGRLNKGKAILSINDHPDIREVFAGLHTEVLDISYLIGGGTHGAAARKELVVWSWD